MYIHAYIRSTYIASIFWGSADGRAGVGTTWVASVMFVWSGSRRLPRVLEIRGREGGGGGDI